MKMLKRIFCWLGFHELIGEYRDMSHIHLWMMYEKSSEAKMCKNCRRWIAC